MPQMLLRQSHTVVHVLGSCSRVLWLFPSLAFEASDPGMCNAALSCPSLPQTAQPLCKPLSLAPSLKFYPLHRVERVEETEDIQQKPIL